MQSAVEADLNQLKVVFALHARMNPAVETGEILKEIVGAAARGARLRAGGAPHRALRRRSSRTSRSIRVPRGAARAVDQAAADHDLARGPAAARLQGGAAGGPQRHRARHVPRLVVPVLALRRDPRRPAPRQLHDLRRTGSARRSGGRSAAGRHQPARLRLHPHLPHAVRAGRDRPLHRPAARASATSSCTPTRPGASPASRTS